MMIMKYADNGNLRQYLNSNFNSFTWKGKLYTSLFMISSSLKEIHEKGLIHHDFHSGNILSDKYEQYGNGIYPYITDLGLSRPAN